MRVIVSLRLHVLWQGERHRPAVGRVGQHPQGLRQAFEDLLWASDAVPPARDRPKAIIDRDGRVAERLDLLQYGIGAPAREDVAGQEQQRESIGMRDGPPPSPCLLRQGRSNSCRPSCGAADSPWRHGEKIDLATLDIVLAGVSSPCQAEQLARGKRLLRNHGPHNFCPRQGVQRL